MPTLKVKSEEVKIAKNIFNYPLLIKYDRAAPAFG